MKARHKKASGGKVFYAGGNSNVAKEAEEKKKGGAVKTKAMKAEGKHSAERLDRKGRKTGGRVGADKSPLSSAHSATSSAKS